MSTLHPVETLSPINESVSPEVDSRLFEASSASYYVGTLAAKNVIFLPVEYQGALRLRANVYIDEFGFLPETARQPDGTERDIDDSRSRHYGVIEKTATGGVVIGNARAIIKESEERLLPAEKYFPEVFSSDAAPLGSLEASRFISRHPNRLIQNATSISLIRTIVAQALIHDNQPVYAIVEEPFHRLIKRIGLPLEQISDVKPVPAYGDTENMVLRFSPQEIVNKTQENSFKHKMLAAYFAEMTLNDGIGYYDEKLMRPFKETSDE